MESYLTELEQVKTAVFEFLAKLMYSGISKFIIMAGMQTGKTAFITRSFIKLQEETVRDGVYAYDAMYMCSNYQNEFIDDVKKDLSFNSWENMPIGLKREHCVNLVKMNKNSELNAAYERASAAFTAGKDLVVYYDESHHGSGSDQKFSKVYQKLLQYSIKHNQATGDNRRLIFVGISATPFDTLAEYLDHTKEGWTVITYKLSDMPVYNSVGNMFDNGRVQSDANFWKSTLSDRFQKVDMEHPAVYRMLASKGRNLYHMVRIPNASRITAVEHLAKSIGFDVKIWDEKHPLEPGYFKLSPTRPTIIVVVQKARMGNRIPTEFIHTMVDYTTKSSSVATIVQSFLGRALGHNKKENDCVVYTNVEVAKAYTLLEGDMAIDLKIRNFLEYMQTNADTLTNKLSRGVALGESKSLQQFPVILDLPSKGPKGLFVSSEIEDAVKTMYPQNTVDGFGQRGKLETGEKELRLQVDAICNNTFGQAGTRGRWIAVIIDRIANRHMTQELYNRIVAKFPDAAGKAIAIVAVPCHDSSTIDNEKSVYKGM